MMRTLLGRPLLLASVTCVLGVPGDSTAWLRIVDGGHQRSDGVEAVLVDGAGDVFTAGSFSVNANDRDFVVVKFDGRFGDELWRQVIDGGVGGVDIARAAALTPNGDVVAAGELRTLGGVTDFAVIKFDGETGAELWRVEIDGSDPGIGNRDVAWAVAVNASGDVVAAGQLDDATTGQDFFVVELDGATGAESWRAVRDGGGSFPNESALDVTVDSVGDVIAVGFLTQTVNSNPVYAVYKFDGATGGEDWSELVDTNPGVDRAEAVTVDDADDVLVAGEITTPGNLGDFSVRKLDGATGVESWHREIHGSGGEKATTVAVDAAGDVVAGGYLGNPSFPTGTDFMVVKLAGNDGSESWRQEIPSATSVLQWARSVAFDPAGDVIAAGAIQDEPFTNNFAVLSFDGASGAQQWRFTYEGTANSVHSALDVALDANGDAFAAGFVDNENTEDDYAVFELDGASGAIVPVVPAVPTWGGWMVGLCLAASGAWLASSSRCRSRRGLLPRWPWRGDQCP